MGECWESDGRFWRCGLSARLQKDCLCSMRDVAVWENRVQVFPHVFCSWWVLGVSPLCDGRREMDGGGGGERRVGSIGSIEVGVIRLSRPCHAQYPG